MTFTFPPKEQVIADFAARLACKSSVNDELYQIQSVQPRYSPCRKDPESLQPILISEMKPGKHHRGRKLLIRACTTPGRVSAAVATVVEDEKDTAVPLFLFNGHPESVQPVDQQIPDGSLCLIKEPFFKANKKKGVYCIRVDHITDIVFLSATDSQLPSCWRVPFISECSQEVRQLGNTFAKKGIWQAALYMYKEALRVATCSEDEQLANLNCALANLRLDAFEDALANAKKALEKDAENLKGLFRAAMAYYGLHNFDSCRDSLLALLAIYPDEPSGWSELKRVEARLLEQATGRYSFASMHNQLKTAPLIDCATYQGPIEVRNSPGRGRGLFLTEAVSVGDLLLCEKAFTYAYGLEKPQASDNVLVMSLDNPRPSNYCQTILSTQIQHRIRINPCSSRSILDLYSGTERTEPEPFAPGTGPAVDAFLVRDIVQFNSTTCPATSMDLMSVANPMYMAGLAYANKSFPGAGIWVKASYLNHSCLANCYCSFIGDMLIVRAAQDIPAGAELTIAYHAPRHFETYEGAQAPLADWQFNCRCALCARRLRTAAQVARKEHTFIRDIRKVFNLAPGEDLALLSAGCRTIDEQFWRAGGPKAFPCVEMCTTLFLQATCSMVVSGPASERIPVILAALRCNGFEIVDADSEFRVTKWGIVQNLMPTMIWVLYVNCKFAAPSYCPSVERLFRTVHTIMFGEDESFAEVFDKLLASPICKVATRI
ncbi:hypothetical protein PWT90_05545 [Aphanocladium album]|nr:hypothetical protein PWT90_05545 [Aphanocladium album]